jgi:hypothetical protein
MLTLFVDAVLLQGYCVTYRLPTALNLPYHAAGDQYPAYNKPEAVIDWMQHVNITEQYVVVLDSDMLLRRPFLTTEFNLSKGWAVGARYDYMVSPSTVLTAMASLSAASVMTRLRARGPTADHLLMQTAHGLTLCSRASCHCCARLVSTTRWRINTSRRSLFAMTHWQVRRQSDLRASHCHTQQPPPLLPT